MVKNWALVIGINYYDFLQPLKYGKRDAQLIQKLLCHEAGFERVFLFADDSPDLADKSTRPDRANLLQSLQQLFAQPFAAKEDNFWLFFIGQGMKQADDDYLIPADGDPDDVANTGIAVSYLVECLRRCGSENIVMILDAGHQQLKRHGEGIGRQTQQICQQTGIISILSCSPQESSAEIAALHSGVFTYALLEGLGIQGQCATVQRLYQYLSFRVPELVEHYKCPPQTPDMMQPGSKSQVILIPKYANLAEIAKRQFHTFPPVINQNLELAQPLKVTATVTAGYVDVNTSVQVMAQSTQLLVRNTDIAANINYKNLPGVETPALSISAKAIANESQTAVDYTHLENLLAASKWQAADQETQKLMLQIATRVKEGWLDIAAINQFPDIHLDTIDQLWVKYSQGRFGFSVQKQVWQSIGGDVDADYETWCEFGDRLGWRHNQNWLFYSDLTFSLSAPVGHLPAAPSVNLLTSRRGWVVGLFSCLVSFSALASKLGNGDRVWEF